MAESDQILDLIKKYESQGRNIQNYRFDPTHTAQGFYQITNTNWNAYGPEAGVDLKKYPDAMSAPEDVQRKVAQHLLEKTPKGLENWETHPKIKAELGMSDQDVDLSKMSREQILNLIKQNPQQYPDLYKQYFPTPVKAPTSTAGFKGLVTAPDDPELTKRQFPPKFSAQGGYIIPGLKKIARGTMGGIFGQEGYEPPGSKFRSGASDIMEGAEDIMEPALLGGAAGTVAAEGSMGALVPYAGNLLKRGALAKAGSELGGLGSRIFSDDSNDPVNKRFWEDVGGWAGGLSPEMYAKLPVGVRARISQYGPMAGGAILGHMLGLPYGIGEIGGAILGGQFAGKGRFSPFIKPPLSEPPAPTGTVKPPTPPTRAESVEMLKRGTIDENRFLEHEAARNSTPQVAKEHLANALAKIKEEQPPPPQPTATVIPEVKTPPQMMTSHTPTEVNLPPGLKIKVSSPVPMQGPPPVNTQLNPPPPSPAPAPGSLGTVGPLGPQPQGPPLAGQAASGTPIGQQLTPQLPVQPPPSNIPPAPGLGPVNPPGFIPSQGPTPKMTPLGTMPPEPFEVRVRKIVEAATRASVPPPKSSSPSTLKRFLKKTELDLVPTKEELLEARKIYDAKTGPTQEARDRMP